MTLVRTACVHRLSVYVKFYVCTRDLTVERIAFGFRKEFLRYVCGYSDCLWLID